MSVDVDAVLAALATVERKLSGIGQVYDTPPQSVTPNDLPAFVNLPGPMTVESMGRDEDISEILETRQYSALLLVAPAGAGVAGESFDLCTPWFAKVRNIFLAYPRLGTTAVLRSTLTGDAGARPDIIYAGMVYYGIRFNLTVQGFAQGTFAAGE